MNVNSRSGRGACASVVAVLLMSFTGNCAIATPFRSASPEGEALRQSLAPEEPVVVSVTHIVVDRQRRDPVDRHSRDIVEHLGTYKGLLGYSVRIEFFGDELWTMTVWKSLDDLEEFVRSERHTGAMIAGRPATKLTRFARLQIPAGEIPIPWDRAQQLLDESEWVYPEH